MNNRQNAAIKRILEKWERTGNYNIDANEIGSFTGFEHSEIERELATKREMLTRDKERNNMYKKTTILAVLLLTSAVTIPAVAEQGRLSTAYHSLHNKLGQHKGKVGLACGAIGTTVLGKVFEKEINEYLKPAFKSICKKIGGWLKKVFRRSK